MGEQIEGPFGKITPPSSFKHVILQVIPSLQPEAKAALGHNAGKQTLPWEFRPGRRQSSSALYQCKLCIHQQFRCAFTAGTNCSVKEPRVAEQCLHRGRFFQCEMGIFVPNNQECAACQLPHTPAHLSLTNFPAQQAQPLQCFQQAAHCSSVSCRGSCLQALLIPGRSSLPIQTSTLNKKK